MKDLFPARQIEQFIFRLDRLTPLPALSGDFELALVASILAAHVDFAASLEPAALAAGLRPPLEAALSGLRQQVWRFQTGLMMLWLSRTLGSSGRSRREPLVWAEDACEQALQHGRTVMRLALPCSLEWYDAAIDRRQFGGARTGGDCAVGGRRAGV